MMASISSGSGAHFSVDHSLRRSGHGPWTNGGELHDRLERSDAAGRGSTRDRQPADHLLATGEAELLAGRDSRHQGLDFGDRPAAVGEERVHIEAGAIITMAGRPLD